MMFCFTRPPNAKSAIRGTSHLDRLSSKSHLTGTSSSLLQHLYIWVHLHTPCAGCACDLDLGLRRRRGGRAWSIGLQLGAPARTGVTQSTSLGRVCIGCRWRWAEHVRYASNLRHQQGHALPNLLAWAESPSDASDAVVGDGEVQVHVLCEEFARLHRVCQD
jgi:hypothetical protein